uniref:Serpin domain-containing protein n=1 Tax=Leptobrachium leishanense TaxID=445787 RepID=A0A8C5WHI6_9ANUR
MNLLLCMTTLITFLFLCFIFSKMKFLLFLCLSISLLYPVVFTHRGGGEHDHNPSDQCENMDYYKIASANVQFSIKLFRQLAAACPSKNVFFSPLSVSTAFAMLSQGAKGQTHDQILEGLFFDTSEISKKKIRAGFQHLQYILNDPDSELQLSSGNALFIDKKIKVLQPFLDDISKYYAAEAFSTDFQKSDKAKQQINSYVKRKTNGKIAELLSSVAKESVLVLANYIYFKGKWDKPFDEKHTKEGDFHVDEKTVVKVPFMRRTGGYYALLSENVTVVDIPYKGDASALFILPKDGDFKYFKSIYQTLPVETWKNKLQYQSLNLLLPKLSLSMTVDLKKELIQLGITDVFSDCSDLSGISKDTKLKVSQAVHKAVLSIDEKGTEAAGATAVEMVPECFPTTVKFDRPFVFVLRKRNTKSGLFLAKVVNPAAE